MRSAHAKRAHRQAPPPPRDRAMHDEDGAGRLADIFASFDGDDFVAAAALARPRSPGDAAAAAAALPLPGRAPRRAAVSEHGYAPTDIGSGSSSCMAAGAAHSNGSSGGGTRVVAAAGVVKSVEAAGPGSSITRQGADVEAAPEPWRWQGGSADECGGKGLRAALAKLHSGVSLVPRQGGSAADE
jgi:hypothetical protein